MTGTESSTIPTSTSWLQVCCTGHPHNNYSVESALFNNTE
jgi:hypothetical protein